MKYGLVASLATALWAGIGALAGPAAVGTIKAGPFPFDMNGSNKTYDFPVFAFEFVAQQQNLQMAFLDVKPCCGKANGHVALLLHGKNFVSITWREQIKALTKAGYRVIAVDSIGFGKSSKPLNFQYSLLQYAWILQGLLNALHVPKVIVMSHSYGGMHAARFALQFPKSVEFLYMTDAVGWEDYTAAGVPYASIDDNLAQEATSNYTTIRAYEQHFYYVDQWDPKFDEWVYMLVNIYWGSHRLEYIQGQAQTVDVVLTQPVVSDLANISVPTYILYGDKDKTFIGAWANPSITANLGNFAQLAPEVCSKIKHCTLHNFSGLGHAPQISEPDLFNQVMLQYWSQQLGL